MTHGGQFNIAFLLVATLVTAVLLAFGQIWPVTFLVGQFLAVYLVTEYLLRKLPGNVSQLQFANTYRGDGTKSLRRESKEIREHGILRSNIRLILLVGIAPWILLIWINAFPSKTVVLASGCWLFASFFVMRNGYLYFLNQFVFNLKLRSQKYKLRDLDLFIREQESTADRNRETFQTIDDGSMSDEVPVVVFPRPQ